MQLELQGQYLFAHWFPTVKLKLLKLPGAVAIPKVATSGVSRYGYDPEDAKGAPYWYLPKLDKLPFCPQLPRTFKKVIGVPSGKKDSFDITQPAEAAGKIPQRVSTGKISEPAPSRRKLT